MPRFRVTIEGGPVFLFDVESKKTERLGFFTTRWVRATTSKEASEIAQRLVLAELAEKGTRNPPDAPVETRVEEVVVLSWVESLRHRGTGSGFTFYSDDRS
jgi:hypothetical protein